MARENKMPRGASRRLHQLIINFYLFLCAHELSMLDNPAGHYNFYKETVYLFLKKPYFFKEKIGAIF